MISVLLVEDHAVFAEALVRVLEGEEDLNVVGVVDSGEAALRSMPQLAVDLALVDVFLPAMNGIELVDKIHQTYPGLPCLMISGYQSRNYVRRSLAAGARGYVLKDRMEAILEGICLVLSGEIYVSKELSS